MGDVILAYEYLFDTVRQAMTDLEISASNVFGWLERDKQIEGATICWVPGDQSGKLGETVAASMPGRLPRPLATVRELFTIYITGFDLTAAENERAQYHATRVLRDQWYAAVYGAAHGRFVIRDESWVNSTSVLHGATLRVVIAFEAMVPELPTDIETLPTTADAVVEALLNDELSDVETVTRVVTVGGDPLTQDGEQVTQTNP